MSVDDFFAPPPNVSHFYTTSLLHHATGEPHPSIGPFTPLSGIAASGEAPMLKMWMGTSGAVTPLHLDSQHNFYAQLHGEKTFRLYPPHAAHEAPPLSRGVSSGGSGSGGSPLPWVARVAARSESSRRSGHRRGFRLRSGVP